MSYSQKKEKAEGLKSVRVLLTHEVNLFQRRLQSGEPLLGLAEVLLHHLTVHHGLL